MPMLRSSFLCSALLLPFVPTLLPAQENKPPAPFEMRLTLKRTEYPLEGIKPGEASPVVLVVELKNNSAQKLTVRAAPEPELQVTGPTPDSVKKEGGPHFFVKQLTTFVLAPG